MCSRVQSACLPVCCMVSLFLFIAATTITTIIPTPALQSAGVAAAFQTGLPHRPQHFSLLMHDVDNAVDVDPQVHVLLCCVC